MEGIYEVAVEMDLGTTIYIPRFIKISSATQKEWGKGVIDSTVTA
jgi:hypothetical protein